MEKFINEGLIEQKADFYEPLKRLKLGMLTKMIKRPVKTKDGKIL